MRPSAPLAALLLALASCGDGEAPAPPPDSGDGSGDAGGGGDAGGSDAGGGADGGPDPGGGGTGAPDAGSGDGGGPGEGGPAAPTVAIERVSDDAECEGLVPSAAPAPVVVRREPAGECLGGTSDGTGAVALGAREGDGVRWQVYTRDGGRSGSFTGSEAWTEPRGWHVLRVTPAGGEPLVEHVAIEPDGSDARSTTVSDDPARWVGFRWSFAQDPLGGALVLFRSVHLFGNHWHALTAHRFDERGGARWAGGVAVDSDSGAAEPLFGAAGVSSRGEALVVYQDSGFLSPRWIDRDGSLLDDPAPTERYGPVVGEARWSDVRLQPLLDGSLALRAGGTWRRTYAHRALATSPLPGWLEARADWTYRFTRGNRGYALFPPPGQASADCTQAVELRAPGGRLCGRLVLREEGTACTTGRVDQGWDGTVVQQSGRDACAYRWWPRLLAGR